MTKHLRAGLIFLVYAVLMVVGTPGLDHLGWRMSKKAEARMTKRLGPGITKVAKHLMDFNKDVRGPVAKKVGGFQPVFRIRQAWNLYRDGPHPIYRLEVRVDGEPVFRSKDPELDWLEAQLSNRRIRPVVESTVKKWKSANWRGLSRFVVAQARAEWPDAERVELVSLKSRRPGNRPRIQHRIVSTSPDWGLEKVR
jgi:hypothetical protein